MLSQRFLPFIDNILTLVVGLKLPKDRNTVRATTAFVVCEADSGFETAQLQTLTESLYHHLFL
jgi:hypothetical protein